MTTSGNFLPLLCITVIVLAISISFFAPESVKTLSETPVFEKAQEIRQIIATLDNKEQVKYYKQLIERVGPEEAQEQLYRSGLPFDGQTHLLNHAAGDWLYEKYGDRGLMYCKDYFLSSCYHGFVIHAIGRGGLNSLTEVMELCRGVGGRTTATQCAHAIGHGLLAYNGYKYLPEALSDCDIVAENSDNFPLYNCYDGVFMENIWAVHTDGKPSPDRWIKTGNNIYPCNSQQIPEKYKRACWSNQPTVVYQNTGSLSKAGDICLGLKDTDYQVTCFDAVARQIHPLTKGSAQNTFELCSTQPGIWKDKCNISVARSAFSVGDRSIPYEVCAQIDGNVKQECYARLAETIVGYARTSEEKRSWCGLIPPEYSSNTLCFE